MKKVSSFLMSVILIITLIIGVSLLYNTESIEHNNQKERNILNINKVKAEEVREKRKLAEELIEQLPCLETVSLEDKILIEDAKELIKAVRVLDMVVTIKDEHMVSSLERKLVRLQQDEVDAKENKTEKDKKIEHQEQVDPISPKERKVTYKEVVELQVIAFETSYVNDANLAKGSSVVQSNGNNGERKIVTKIKYVDDKETSREIISNVVTKNPINKVIVLGTKVEYIDTTGQTGAMFNEINKSRSQFGLAGLSRSARLDAAASVRVKEIITNFSHTRPNGALFNTVDIDVISGENIAYGSMDPILTHQRFMASQGHKDNVLRGAYKSVGLSSFKGSTGPTYWVVLFSRY